MPLTPRERKIFIEIYNEVTEINRRICARIERGLTKEEIAAEQERLAHLREKVSRIRQNRRRYIFPVRSAYATRDPRPRRAHGEDQ